MVRIFFVDSIKEKRCRKDMLPGFLLGGKKWDRDRDACNLASKLGLQLEFAHLQVCLEVP